MLLNKKIKEHLLLSIYIPIDFFSSSTFLLSFCYIGGHSWHLGFFVEQVISSL